MTNGTFKQYEKLNFTDDFIFGKVLTNNKELCRKMLELILDEKIKRIDFPEIQKSLKPTYESKGVRLDVYVEGDGETVYDLEMQTVAARNIPKRARYYHGMLDLNMLEKGADYEQR